MSPRHVFYLVIVLLVNIFYVNGSIRNFSNDPNDLEDFEEFVMRMVGGTTVTRKDYPWMLFVFNEVTSTFKGFSVGISVKWAISPTAAVKDMTMTDIALYRDSPDLDNYKAGAKHTVRELVIHEFANGYQNAIVLMRLCPRLTDSALLPLPEPTYQSGTLAQMCKFSVGSKVFVYIQKAIGDPCECATDAQWDQFSMTCLENHPTLYGQTNDLDIPVTINNRIEGFLLKPQLNYSTFDGEMLTNIGAHLDWIKLHTDIV